MSYVVFAAICGLVVLALVIDGTITKVTNKVRTALKGGLKGIKTGVNDWLDGLFSRYKWWGFAFIGMAALGYWLHMVLTSQTGAALRGTMRVMS